MTEQLIDDISIERVDLSHVNTGGAYRETSVNIVVDSSRDIREQKISLAHEIMGCYLGAIIDCQTITEMAEHIVDGIDQLNGGAK
ncbi:MAG: hypothetical protein ACFFD4_07800 [Candidatus Odinarchaeota archaeon]